MHFLRKRSTSLEDSSSNCREPEGFSRTKSDHQSSTHSVFGLSSSLRLSSFLCLFQGYPHYKGSTHTFRIGVDIYLLYYYIIYLYYFYLYLYLYYLYYLFIYYFIYYKNFNESLNFVNSFSFTFKFAHLEYTFV